MLCIKLKEDRIHAAASLNRDLCYIEQRAASLNVLFGAAKCKSVIISNRRGAEDDHHSLRLFGTSLTEVETVQLLGLTMSKDLFWKHDVTIMAKSATQRTALLCRVAPYLLPAQRTMIYKAIIRSKMGYSIYCIELLSPHWHNWMPFKYVLFASLAFLRVTFPLIKSSL